METQQQHQALGDKSSEDSRDSITNGYQVTSGKNDSLHPTVMAVDDDDD